jgi:hypothetical protein
MPAITQEDWITISRLRLMLECTWYKLIRYQKLSVLPLPDMIVNGRGMWRAARFPAIKAAVDAYEEAIRQAERNELQTQARADREAQEARKAELNTYREGLVRAAETL